MDTPPIRIVRDAVTRAELAVLAERQFGDMVKVVVDMTRGGNRSRHVEDEGLRAAIRGIMFRLVTAA